MYHGHDGMRSWHRDLDESWGEEISLEPEAHFDLGDRVFTLLVYRARGERSGADVAMPAAAVGALRDGRFTYIRAYSDREAALRDLGLTADDLDPIDP